MMMYENVPAIQHLNAAQLYIEINRLPLYRFIPYHQRCLASSTSDQPSF